jgi:hypothetical protein
MLSEIETLVRFSRPCEPQTPETAAVLYAEQTTQTRNKAVVLSRLLGPGAQGQVRD